MKEGGADISKLELRYYSPNYRGVHAKHHIKQGERILFVPVEQMLTWDYARDHSSIRTVIDGIEDQIFKEHFSIYTYALFEL